MKVVNNRLTHELHLRTEANYPVEGVEFIDITPLILQKDTLKEITEKFVSELKDKNIDYIVAPEARGFLFGSSIANEIDAGLVPVRKKGKLSPSTVEVQFDYEKEYGKDTLELPKLVNSTYEGKRFYVVDDILATGNTMKSIIKAITDLGGIIIGHGVVMNIVELNDDKEVFSLIDINED